MGRPEAFESAHRPQPCLQPAVVSFDRIIGVLLGHVRRGRDQFVDHPQVRAGLVGGDLDGRRTLHQRLGEEPSSRCAVPLLGQQHVDDLAVLVDGPVQVPPPAGDLDVGLVDEPPVSGGMPERASGVGEQRGEPLHPPVDADVVDLDAPLAQQLLPDPDTRGRSGDTGRPPP